MAVAQASLESKFQRELNRSQDSDRNTRKRGLQKLLEDLPWASKAQKQELRDYVHSHLLKSITDGLTDTVEKCREISVNLLRKCLDLCPEMNYDVIVNFSQRLCSRVNDIPFPEESEELRLLVVDTLVLIVKHKMVQAQLKASSTNNVLTEMVLKAMTKTLNDSFPSVKRSCAELISLIAKKDKPAVSIPLKLLMKGLVQNAQHQHSKTRSLSIAAIADCLSCVKDKYKEYMDESVLPLFLRLESDRTASVRMELAHVCSSILTNRWMYYLKNDIKAILRTDLQLVCILFLLCGDESEDVSACATSSIREAVSNWKHSLLSPVEGAKLMVYEMNDNGMDIDNAELALKQSELELELEPAEQLEKEPVQIVDEAARLKQLPDFINHNLIDIMDIMIEGIESWNSLPKKRYLNGMEILLQMSTVNTVRSILLTKLILSLGSQIKHEDAEVRTAAEKCCKQLGSVTDPLELLEVLIPRVNGSTPGGDTSSHRTSAIRVLTQVTKGIALLSKRTEEIPSTPCTENVNRPVPIVTMDYVATVSTALANTDLFAFREAATREAALLLVRCLLETFPVEIKTSVVVRKNLALSLVYLNGRCKGEEDVVPQVAQVELSKLAAISDLSVAVCEDSPDLISQFLRNHFDFLLYTVLTDETILQKTTSAPSKVFSDPQFQPNWESSSPAKSAFEVLIRQCCVGAWENYEVVLNVMRNLCRPKECPAQGSAEANALSYASQRGEEIIPEFGEVDVRLSLLALLEDMVRQGTQNWECGRHIAAASELILGKIIVPNLIWRVGRVEATVRKVALAACYSMLKAGALEPQTLFNTATELVPLIVSNLDDSELTPRQMACLCLTVLFERLRGAFSEQSISQMYPKLLARLDDSSDLIRQLICQTLVMFLQCAVPSFYSSTMVDYTLDQLFIHLDDPNIEIQAAVYDVVITMAKIDKELTTKKAKANRLSHRSPDLCNKIIFEVEGIEILDE